MIKPFKCPICKGRGIVPGGFYTAVGDTWSSNCITEKCRQCNGLGIILVSSDGSYYAEQKNGYAGGGIV